MTGNSQSLLSLTGLGGNDDGSMCRTGTIEGSSIRALQYRHRKDILRIKVGNGILEIAPHTFGIELRIVYRDAIHNEKRLILSCYGGLTTYHNTAGTHITLTVGNADTCQLT